MQALIDFLIRNLMALWPLARIYSWQQGVRIRFGILREELGPGIHWRWPFADEVYAVLSVEQTIDMPAFSITTTDGESVVLSASLAYRIHSCKQMWQHVNDVEGSTQNIALGYLAEQCSEYSWEELQSDRETVTEGLDVHLTSALVDWGVEITRVHLTDVVRARQYRVFGDSWASEE